MNSMNSICLILHAAAAAAAATVDGVASPARKHVIAILADDYGWADASWHRPPGYREVQTPNMDVLVKQGVELDRHYVYKFCSPTRSAAQSGRNPIHVNTLNLDPLNYNPQDNVSGYAGVPHNMTGVAEVMKSAGYSTAFFGKWDCGMATMRHTPKGRGYDRSMLYFHHMEDYWQNWFENPNGDTDFFPKCKQIMGNVRPRDLWMSNASYEGPALGFTNVSANCSVGTFDLCQSEMTCSPYPGFPGDEVPGCTYVDHTFTEQVKDTINKHDQTKPLFLFWAPHTIHTPLQVPQNFYDQFSFISDWRRRRYHAMVAFMDARIGEVIDTLKSKDMFEDSVIFFSSDNGGPIYGNGDAGANNYPLKGGKASNWEGGVRVNAWVSGGAIPTNQRGKKLEGLTTIWDWYKTFAGIAGADPTDHVAAAAGLPPVDGFDIWPYVSGSVDSSPRSDVILGTNDGDVNGIIWSNGTDLWKLLRSNAIPMSGWTGPQTPNSTFITPGSSSCTPCLFKLDKDPSEHHDLANSTSSVLSHLDDLMTAAKATGFSPVRGPQDPKSCIAAVTKYPEYWGPWVTPVF